MSQRHNRHPRPDAGNLQDGAIMLTLSSANPCMGISLASSLAGIARACLVTLCVFGRPACRCMHVWGSGVRAWDRDLVRACVRLDSAGTGSGVCQASLVRRCGGRGRHGRAGIQCVGSQLVGEGAGTACGNQYIRLRGSPPSIQNIVSTGEVVSSGVYLPDSSLAIASTVVGVNHGPWALGQSVKGVLGNAAKQAAKVRMFLCTTRARACRWGCHHQ